MKKRERAIILLMGAAILSLLALAALVAFLQWKSSLLTQEVQRKLEQVEADLAKIENIMADAQNAGAANMAGGETVPAIEILDANVGEALTEQTAGNTAGNANTAGSWRDGDTGSNPGNRNDGNTAGTADTVKDSDSTDTANTADAASAAAGAKSTSESGTNALPPHHIIFVGDSRTVGMGHAEADQGDGCTYIGESGEGCNWLIEYGIDQMDEAIRAYPEAPVVFNFGVNDCENINAYIEVYQSIELGYPDTAFYYMSVNPVTKESIHVPLSDVLAFNRQLKAAFPERYIDTCSWMIRGGFEDVDGIHYSEDQYCKIHDFAVNALAF